MRRPGGPRRSISRHDDLDVLINNPEDTRERFDALQGALARVRAEFPDAARAYKDLSRSCESRVVRWRWASSPLFSLRAYYFERNRFGKGRWLADEPVGNWERCQYGFDAHGRPIVERQGVWGSARYGETFFTYEGDYDEALRFDANAGRNLLAIELRRVEEGLPVAVAYYAAHQQAYEVYGRTAGSMAVASADCTWTNPPHRPQDLLSARYAFDHDDARRLSKVTMTYRRLGRHPGGTFTTFQTPRRPDAAGG